MSRVVLVTGAASGNGAAIAERFLAAGDRVVAVDINRAELESAFQRNGQQALPVVADVASATDIETCINRALDHWGRLDVLVNNAGITGSQAASDLAATPVEEFDRVMAVNIRGIFLACKLAIPAMLDQGSGVIVNIASVAGLVAFPGRAAYSISKGAVVQLTRSVAVDYAARGIRCNAICPGMIDTPMTRWRLEQPELRAQMLEHIPQRTIGSAKDVAGAVVFLASPDASYFNGAALVMDGGYTSV